MAIKNIEMSVYNGSSYDTLLPVTSDENVTIASAISGLFGLGADSTLTDILQKLSNAVIWDGSSTELPNGSSIVTGARIETGSYVGTGTYGASNPCSLTFNIKPKIFWIYGYKTNDTNIYIDSNFISTANFSYYTFREQEYRSIIFLDFVLNDYQTPQIGETLSNSAELLWKSYYKLGLIITPINNNNNTNGIYSTSKFDKNLLTFYWYIDGILLDDYGRVTNINAINTLGEANVINTVQFNNLNYTYYWLAIE